MKQQKLVDIIDWKEKKLLNLKNDKGVSLIELMITTAIGLTVSLAIATVFSFAMEQFTILVEKNAAEENNLKVAFHLRNFLSQGVDVYAVNNVNPVGYVPPVGSCTPYPACTVGAGQLDINFEMLVPASWGGVGGVGNFSPFATFNREAGFYTGGAMTNTGSVMQTTAIFIKDVDTTPGLINPDDQSGGVIVDHNANGIGPIIPDPSDLVFTRLHNFRIQRIPAGAAACPNGYAVEVVRASDGLLLPCLPAGWAAGGAAYKVKTVTLEVFTRYFKTLPKDDWNYRYPIGGGVSSPFMDITQTIKINFKDNVLTSSSLTGGSSEQRVFGSLYFYHYITGSGF